MPRHVAHSPATDGGPFQPLFEDDSEIRAHARAVAEASGAFAQAFGSQTSRLWRLRSVANATSHG